VSNYNLTIAIYTHTKYLAFGFVGQNFAFCGVLWGVGGVLIWGERTKGENGAYFGLWCVVINCTNANKWRRADKMRLCWLWCALGDVFVWALFFVRLWGGFCALCGLCSFGLGLSSWCVFGAPRLVLRWCGSDALVLFIRAP
jgi:hypothetical protein